MRILKYALKNIIRNPILSLSSIFVIGLLIFFVNILIFVLFASERFIASVNSRISFTINFQSGYTVTSPDARILVQQLEWTFSGIVVESISKEDALLLLQSRNPDLATLVENTGENPLPDSIRIDNIPIDQYSAFNTLIEKNKHILQYNKDAFDRKLLDYQSQFSRIAFVVYLLSLLEFGVFALLIFFAFTVSVILYTVVSNSIFFFRQEIEIIHLVGGRSSFIYGPFLLQGFFFGTMATVLVLGVVFLIQSFVQIDFVNGPLAHVMRDFFLAFPLLGGVQVGIAAVLGMISAGIALRKYVREGIFG